MDVYVERSLGYVSRFGRSMRTQGKSKSSSERNGRKGVRSWYEGEKQR